MMKKFLISLIAIVTLPCTAWADDAVNQFIPKGFNLLETHCQADFNKDGKKDCVLLIKDTKKSAWQMSSTDKLVDRNRRGIVILFKTKQGYKKVLENKAIFASENEEGGVYFAPELEIIAKNHQLKFSYNHGRYGTWDYTFDYRTIDGVRDFYWIGYDASSDIGPYAYFTQSVNFLTHKYRYQKNLAKDETTEPKFKSTWFNLPKKPILRLAEIADIDEAGISLASQLYEVAKPDEQ